MKMGTQENGPARPRKTKPKATKARQAAPKPAKPQTEWELRLYIAGETRGAVAAFANLERICERHLKGKYRIEVIDLMKNPILARGDQILRSPRSSASCPRP